MKDIHKIIFTNKSLNTFKIVLLLFLAGITILPSCKISYSMSGTNIPLEIETFSVQYFPNRAPLVQSQLSQVFTDALKDKIEGQTRLEMVTGFGDVDLSGEIKNYETRPVAITGDERAALNRLTIAIRVKYTNSFNPDENFDTQFSRYEDYSSSSNLSDVEEDLIELIVENIVEDVFNKAFVNW
ncbi:MAG: LptE family protein [Bacteroidales bacterium]|nr:LptE family protein [Bacteroidales bacterium]